jgi:hypothetical protein
VPAETLNPRYGAPELAEGQPSPASDQYSLALLFQELLLGVHPLRGLYQRGRTAPRGRAQPNVELLPAPDRPVVLSALDPDPAERFPTLTEFVDALERATPEGRHSSGLVRRPTLGCTSPVVETPVAQAPPPRTPRQLLDELVNAVARGFAVRSSGRIFYQLQPGPRVSHRCWVRFLPGMLKLKLDGFRQQWKAQEVSATERTFAFEVRGRRSFLARCFGQGPGLRLDVRLGLPQSARAGLTPLAIEIAPLGCSGADASGLLDEFAPALLTSLHGYLQPASERPDQERYPYAEPVQLVPGALPGRPATPLPARARVLARDGLTAVVVSPLPGREAVVVLPSPAGTGQTFELPARVASTEPTAGGHELELLFDDPAEAAPPVPNLAGTPRA